MEVCLLRGVAARNPDGSGVVIAGTGLQALLALLALAVPNSVSIDRLIDELWGDEQPGNPDNALQAKISQLRRLLGRDLVVHKDGGYHLDVDTDTVDVLLLEKLVRQGRVELTERDYVSAAARYTAALALQHGEPLRDLAGFRFAQVAATRIAELVLAAHEGLADCRLALGQHVDAVGPLTDAVRDHPYRERFHAQLMLALYRCGRQADALRAYKSARDVLVNELGLEPGAELQALQQAVLAQDAALTRDISMAPAMPNASALPGQRDLDAWRAVAATQDNPSARLAFVGRARERQVIDASIADMLAGAGGAVLLEGEPGIGKSRLAEELTREAMARGSTVVWSRCYEGRGAPAFWTWTEVLHALLDRTDRHEFRSALATDASDLAPIVPEIKELFDDIDPPVARDPEAARFRICQAVTATLRRLSLTRPIVVVVDDLHWADPSSMDEFEILAAGAQEHRVLVVATYRSVDPTFSDGMTNLLARLSTRASVRRLQLRGFQADELAQFLRAAGATPTNELVSTIEERTRGNPFFITEILRLVPGDSGAADARVIERVVPANIKEVILRRVDRLPDATSQALLAASVLGHEFDIGLLSMIADVDEATVLDRLEPAQIAGLLVENRGRVGRFRFSHGLVREAMYEDMGVAQRARMHRRAGEALEARHGASDGPHLLPMAEHWYHAVPIAQPQKGVEYARRAAMWALGRVADHQAEAELNWALELIATMPADATRAALELEVLDQLSSVLIGTTSYVGEGIARAAARTRELCDEMGDQARLVPALWRLTTHHMVRGEIDAGLSVGNELIARGAADDGLRSATLAGHVGLGILLTQRGGIIEARRHLDAAIEMCDAGFDAPLIGLVIEEPAVFSRAFSAINMWLRGDDVAAEEHARRAIEIGTRDGPQFYSATIAFWSASTVSMLRRDARTTIERSDVGTHQCLTYGYAPALHVFGVTHGWAVAALGDPKRGAHEVRHHADAFCAIGALYLRPLYLAVHAEVCLMDDDAAEANRSIDEGFSVAADTGEAWFEAELHRLRGEAYALSDPRDPQAVASMRRAVEVATAQGSENLRLRAESSLARLRAG
jgi:DNA-binding SARP family transcriptional activator